MSFADFFFGTFVFSFLICEDGNACFPMCVALFLALKCHQTHVSLEPVLSILLCPQSTLQPSGSQISDLCLFCYVLYESTLSASVPGFV